MQHVSGPRPRGDPGARSGGCGGAAGEARVPADPARRALGAHGHGEHHRSVRGRHLSRGPGRPPPDREQRRRARRAGRARRALWPRLQDRGCGCRGRRVRRSRHRSGHRARVRPPGRAAVRTARGGVPSRAHRSEAHARRLAVRVPASHPRRDLADRLSGAAERRLRRRRGDRPGGRSGPRGQGLWTHFRRPGGAGSRRRPDRCRQGGDCLLAARPSPCALRRSALRSAPPRPVLPP